MLQMWKLSLVILLGSVTGKVFAVNGMPIELAPSTELGESATHAVGALMRTGKFVDNDGTTKEVEHSRGNVIYIGNNARGSVLLVHALHVTTNGKADPKRLEDLKLMFGPAVSDLRVGKWERRYWYPSLTDAKIYVHPDFESTAKDGKESPFPIAIIEMPIHFAEPRKPVSLIASGSMLPSRAALYTVGMGHESNESADPKALLSPFEAQKTSGKLRLAAMQLDGLFTNAMLKAVPLSYDDWEAIQESKFPTIDGLVDGPCDWDGGAPLFLEGSRLTTINDQTVAVQSLSLVGLNYSNGNTCIRSTNEANKPPLVAYLNLARPEIQRWIRKYIE